MKINYTRCGTVLYALCVAAACLSYYKIRNTHAEYGGCTYNTSSGVLTEHAGAVCYTNPASFEAPHLWNGPTTNSHTKESVLGCGWADDAEFYNLMALILLLTTIIGLVFVVFITVKRMMGESVQKYIVNVYNMIFVCTVAMFGLIVWASIYDFVVVYCVTDEGIALDHSERKTNRDLIIVMWSFLSPIILIGLMRMFSSSESGEIEVVSDTSEMLYLPEGKYGTRMLLLFNFLLFINGILTAKAGEALDKMSKDAHHLDYSMDEDTLIAFGYTYVGIAVTMFVYICVMSMTKSADDKMKQWEMWVYGGLFTVVIPLGLTIMLMWSMVALQSAGLSAHAGDVESSTHDFAKAHTSYMEQDKLNAIAASNIMGVGILTLIIVIGCFVSFLVSDYMIANETKA